MPASPLLMRRDARCSWIPISLLSKAIPCYHVGMELFGSTRAELSHYCEQLGHHSFRGKQIADWIYARGCRSAEDMSNLPGALRSELSASATITRSDVAGESRSTDGTTKLLLRLSDGETIESVLIPYEDRVSVCVSTQVGCAIGCTFCATADCGFVRNLTPGEILDQVATLRDHSGGRVSHVVFMGMGEPLANLENVLRAVDVLHSEFGISMRRITISTVGLTPAIRKLAELDLQITLAVSLHAPSDDLRARLIPYATRFPLPELIDACRNYANHTRRRVTFEYLLLAGVNDSPRQAVELGRLLRGILCHVNLIPYNKVIGKCYERPSKGAIAAFRSALEKEGVEVTQRMERGHAVSAACGQLRKRTGGQQ